MLSRNEIIANYPHNIDIYKVNEDTLGENYLNVTLANDLKVYTEPFLDIKKSNPTQKILIPEEGLVLEPGKLYLGRTNEYTKTYNFVPLLGGTDKLAALGMEIHVTAGFGDHGFEGTWTLEIVCTYPTKVYPNMPIGRLYYFPLIGDNSIEYKGKYLGQVKATESRIEREYVPKLERRK